VAPNLITLVAFLIVLISHCVFMFWGGDQFGKPVPGWKCVLMCVTIFLYQHLDNMDGKQARKTSNELLIEENSTPVGMLFDHGADAITAVLFGIQLLCVFGVQSYDLSIFLACYFVFYPNFAGLWNQYSIGHFNLDRINPID
jgi:phosphatidylglycerophosphate synthase